MKVRLRAVENENRLLNVQAAHLNLFFHSRAPTLASNPQSWRSSLTNGSFYRELEAPTPFSRSKYTSGFRAIPQPADPLRLHPRFIPPPSMNSNSCHGRVTASPKGLAASPLEPARPSA